MKRLSLLLLVFIILLAACKKKTSSLPTVPFSASQYFFPLAVGNYWVYKIIDSTYYTEIDTVRITSDTIINGIAYYCFYNFYGWGPSGYYGDSAGTILAYPGDSHVLLSNQPDDTLAQWIPADSFFTVVRTGNIDTVVNAPARAFNTIQIITTEEFPPSYSARVQNPRNQYSFYAKNTGLIYSTNYYEYMPAAITMQLISYHISP